MMRKSLMILGILGTIAFLVAGGLGLQGSASLPVLQQHLYWALAACLLMLLSHSTILIYLVATQRMIRRTAAEGGFEPRFAVESRSHVARTLPTGLLAVGAMILVVLAGAGLLARFTPPWTHRALVLVALVLQLGALWLESRALSGQDRLITELDRRVGA